MTVEERVEKLEQELAETKRELAEGKRLGTGDNQIQRLEKRVRVTAALACGLALLSFAVLLAGAQTAPNVVEAQKFVLKDESGRIRAELLSQGGGPSLVYYDREGNRRANFSAADDGSAWLHFTDKDKNSVFAIVVGATGVGHMHLACPDGQIRFLLSLTNELLPTMTLRDQKGNLLWEAP
jgi:hypothetical protein